MNDKKTYIFTLKDLIYISIMLIWILSIPFNMEGYRTEQRRIEKDYQDIMSLSIGINNKLDKLIDLRIPKKLIRIRKRNKKKLNDLEEKILLDSFEFGIGGE